MTSAKPIDQYRRVAAAGPAQDEHQLVLEYAPLVKRIAYHLSGRLPQTVEIEDLVQAGTIGLIEAARKFDPENGASFETFASIRIRGAMIDQVRPCDWTPRSVHRRSRELSEAMRRVGHRLGREPRDTEVMEELGMSAEEYHAALRDVATSRMVSFEEICPTGDEPAGLPGTGETPHAEADEADFRAALAEGIRGLSEREQQVLSMYYDDELNLREIGEVLGVTESRVCQIHAKSMLRLRAQLLDWAEERPGAARLLERN
jgi:RNA polymerase sigma factor for flagellar operon FliA